MSTHLKTILVVLSVCLGIGVSEVTNFGSEIAIISIIILFAQLLLILVCRQQTIDNSKYIIPIITILICFGLFVGIIRSQFIEEKTNFICVESCTFDAKIISSPETRDAYQIFKVRNVKSDDITYDIQVRTPLYPKYQIGEIIKLSGKVTEPNIIFPHDENKIFDYASYLQTKNVGSEMFE